MRYLKVDFPPIEKSREQWSFIGMVKKRKYKNNNWVSSKNIQKNLMKINEHKNIHFEKNKSKYTKYNQSVPRLENNLLVYNWDSKMTYIDIINTKDTLFINLYVYYKIQR